MKKVILAAFSAVLVLAACQKEVIEQQQQGPIMQMSLSDGGTSYFDAPSCQDWGTIAQCCRKPPADCSRIDIVVTPTGLSVINGFDSSNPSNVANFFATQDWMEYFPQLENETAILADIAAGLYSWEKHNFGEYLWIDFVSDNADDFALALHKVD